MLAKKPIATPQLKKATQSNDIPFPIRPSITLNTPPAALYFLSSIASPTNQPAIPPTSPDPIFTINSIFIAIF